MKEEILKLRSLGKTYNEIVKILGCSKASVSYHSSSTVRENFKLYRRKNRKKQRDDIKISFGGKCVMCGYDKCLSALDFHHPDPSKKDDNVGRLLSEKGKLVAYKEAKKCKLVCRNCHAELHYGFDNISV